MGFKNKIGIVSFFSATFLIVSLATRIMIVIQTPEDSGLTATLLAKAFATGFYFDLASLAYILVPIALYLVLAPERMVRNRYHVLVNRIFYAVFVFILLFDVTAEYLFFDEFSTRFNFIAVDYLVYTREVVGNIMDSYHVKTLLAVIFLISLSAAFLLGKTIDRAGERTFRSFRRRITGCACLATPIAAFFLVSISASDISKNDYAVEIAQNGIYSLFAAFRNNSLDYSRFYLSEDNSKAIGGLRTLLSEKNSRFVSRDGITRHIVHEGTPEKLNVILVVEESLSASFLGCYGNTDNITPNLDRLSGESLFFTHLYANGTRTVRGLEAVSISMPPLPGISIIKRPDNKGFRSWGEIMDDNGYDSKFIYAGYGYFDNMNDFFAGNGYHVVDRSNFSKDETTFATIWGVCDEDLFNKVIMEADKSYGSRKPFFSTVMTTSNHRPYEYPAGKIDIPPEHGGRRGCVKYADYAIGKLVNDASKKPWFKDTVFVLVADHCASSAGKMEIPLKKYEIPLLIYSPAHIKPAHVDRLMSQIDIPPTVLGLMNISYTSDFFGRDIMKAGDKKDYAFLSTYQKLGLIEDGTLGVFSPGKKSSFYTFDRKTGEERQSAAKPGFVETMFAYYQGADYIFRNRLNRSRF